MIENGQELNDVVCAAYKMGCDQTREVHQKRIEKLEAALRAIIVHCEVPAPPNAEALKMFARNALEGKDD
jgi:predicted alternative tryptophan synthase beta-subunit